MHAPTHRARRHAAGSTRSAATAAACLAAVAILAGACSSSGDEASPGTAATATGAGDVGSSGSTITTWDPDRLPSEIVATPVEGNGIVLPQPAAPLPAGYEQQEYLVDGTATSFAAVETPDDGFWTVEPSGEADYRTRVIVRRPGDPADFSGTVVVEWFNVSAIEADPDWGYNSEEIGREGHAYIGVSTQAQGVEGGATILEVNVDPEAAADAGTSTDTSGLKNIDPERYGTLAHPGDAYAFDIFTQVGRAAAETPELLLGDLDPTQVIGVGESQSAMFLTTLVNAVHPVSPAFDGFLIHSRAASAAPMDGDFLGATETQDPAAALSQGVRIRTDLDVPVAMYEAETDLTLLGYANARQPDTERIRTWEVAGTAHADAQTLRSMLGGPRDPSIGSLLGCESINTGPHKETVQALLHHLVAWAAGGDAPPEAPRLELVDDAADGSIVIARGDDGNALGGVRNPLVDAPTATLTGEPPDGASIADLAGGSGDLCILFGSTIPFDQAALVERYGDADGYVSQFTDATETAVAGGFLLRPDADVLLAEAEANRTLFP
ncbi:MAG: alpha/beta hydrolase domain-containing protein [Acidimicrobiales bacterium]|nr:hypothetical protein [Acidimicrobiales bacterium]